MQRNTSLVAIMIIALALLGSACSGAMNALKAAQAAASEDASIEVSLDRIEDIDESMKQIDTILFQTPVQTDSAWVGQLAQLDNARANQYTGALKQAGAYSLPKRNIPKIKVFRLHNADILKEAASAEAEHPSVMAAFASISGEKGNKIMEAYKGLGDLKKSIAELEAQRAIYADQEGKDAELVDLDKQIAAKEAEVDPAEEALFKTVEELGAVKASADNQQLAKTLFKVFQHVAVMELEAATTATIVALQVPLAVPNVPTEMQNLATRWVGEMVQEITGTAGDLANIKPEIAMVDGSPTIKLSGLDDANLADLPNRLTERVVRFYDQATGAPGRVVSIAGQASFQAKFLVSIAQALANMAGETFNDGANFAL